MLLQRKYSCTLLLDIEPVRVASPNHLYAYNHFLLTVPESYDVAEEIMGSLQSNELKYFELEFPSYGITFTLTVDAGFITFYISDTVQNPNEEQGYDWKVETNSSAEVFLDPDSLNREPGTYVYIGLEGGSSINNFSLNSTSGDRRSKLQHALRFIMHYLHCSVYSLF